MNTPEDAGQDRALCKTKESDDLQEYQYSERTIS